MKFNSYVHDIEYETKDQIGKLRFVCISGAKVKGCVCGGGGGLGRQRAERQFTWRWKSKRLINRCLLGHL